MAEYYPPPTYILSYIVCPRCEWAMLYVNIKNGEIKERYCKACGYHDTKGGFFMKGNFVCPCCGVGALDPKLTLVLQSLERQLGEELYIDNGHRCEKHNKEVGGESNSAHLPDPSLAADVRCITSQLRYKMLKILFAMGVHRIGIMANAIHIDIGHYPPYGQDCVWHYYKKG